MAELDIINIEEETRQLQQQKSLWKQEEENQRHDYRLRLQMSPVERSASRVIQELCGALKATGSFVPTMLFSQSRHLLENNDVWQALSKMPKGCLLHAHAEAMIEPEWLVNQALDIPGYVPCAGFEGGRS
ncbi:hypothetical protein BDW74DRAFT_173715 [Aspergillus multicolor]|uniref:uncharacterized protein n=1 Tax=Aspergillus multicolor TaxID=41759 RepID=UPI003CCD6554